MYTDEDAEQEMLDAEINTMDQTRDEVGATRVIVKKRRQEWSNAEEEKERQKKREEEYRLKLDVEELNGATNSKPATKPAERNARK
jgi:hypothetical protein